MSSFSSESKLSIKIFRGYLLLIPAEQACRDLNLLLLAKKRESWAGSTVPRALAAGIVSNTNIIVALRSVGYNRGRLAGKIITFLVSLVVDPASSSACTTGTVDYRGLNRR